MGYWAMAGVSVSDQSPKPKAQSPKPSNLLHHYNNTLSVHAS